VSLPFVAVGYDPAVHAAFVRDSWARGAQEPRERLDELLREEGSRCVVAHLRGRPDDFLGWAARTADALVFAYTKPVVRKRGLARGLVTALGFSETPGVAEAPLPLLIWTPSAQRLAAEGWPLYYAPFRERNAA